MFKKNASSLLYGFIVGLIALHFNVLNAAETLRFAVISDMNKSYGSTDYLNDLDKAIDYLVQHKDSIPLVLSTGDMVAGQKKGLDYMAMWRAFHQKVTHPLKAANLILAPSPGNHDASSFSPFKVEREFYKQTWSEKQNEIAGVSLTPTSHYPFYYAFTYKSALFISLDATEPNELSSEQLIWLQETLINHGEQKLKIIFGHVPLYPFAYNRAHEYMEKNSSQSILESLFRQYGVDLYLSGHHHAYFPGHRFGKTAYVSVPLLGTGKRQLLTPNRFSPPRGFLIVEFKEGSLSVKEINTQDMSVVPLSSLPERIQIPSQSSSSCRACGSFPTQHFLDPNMRSLYERIDL